MKPHKRLLSVALLVIALITGLSLWLVQVSAPISVSDRLQQGAVMRVGFAVEAPYAFMDHNGEVTGEAPEIFRHIARQLGITRIDWVRMDFASLLPELQIGRIDAVAAGMFITPDRQRVASFSRPTARVRPALIVRSTEMRMPGLPVMADLPAAKGVRWMTVHGAAEEDLLKRAGISPEQISTVAQVGRGLRAVAEGKADALAISAVTARHLVAQHPAQVFDVRVLSDGPVGLPAFVFRLEDSALRDAMDQALHAFLGSEQHAMLVRGFGFTSEEQPPGPP